MRKLKRFKRRIAYFSMEIALDPAIPTYSGGLGMLAGDTIRSAADLRVPMVAVTLLYRRGYFFQRLDAQGWQHEEPALWNVDDFLEPLPERASITIEGRLVQIRAWRREVVGVDGYRVPVILLDTDMPENSSWDRTLTHHLYGGDHHYRLCQEIVLGIGGLRMLRGLEYDGVERYHMNEGHAALLAFELLEERLTEHGRVQASVEDVDAVKDRCVFTTHTPVPAGHDKFHMDMVVGALGRKAVLENRNLYESEGMFNMTRLALNLSRFVNAVAKRHAEVTTKMFPEHPVAAITNGVHAFTWASQPFQELFDLRIPDWRSDGASLRTATRIPNDEIWASHRRAKMGLLQFISRHHNAGMDVDAFTIGFARRSAMYKRAGLLFRDADRLKHIATTAGPLQIIYAGKAHPNDRQAKELIQHVFQAKSMLGDAIKIIYLENYDMELGKLITSGVDLWLNTPQSPLEASGTSGMTSAVNGVPSLSVLDGWWVEGAWRGHGMGHR